MDTLEVDLVEEELKESLMESHQIQINSVGRRLSTPRALVSYPLFPEEHLLM